MLQNLGNYEIKKYPKYDFYYINKYNGDTNKKEYFYFLSNYTYELLDKLDFNIFEKYSRESGFLKTHYEKLENKYNPSFYRSMIYYSS